MFVEEVYATLSFNVCKGTSTRLFHYNTAFGGRPQTPRAFFKYNNINNVKYGTKFGVTRVVNDRAIRRSVPRTSRCRRVGMPAQSLS